MKNWQIKELSSLTGISVRTLHHYDEINLLKSTHRLENGYRVYSEKDLHTLQHIIALKSFGFNLKKVKELLKEQTSFMDQLKMQQTYLHQKLIQLKEASFSLTMIIEQYKDTELPDHTAMLELIRLFDDTNKRMAEWSKSYFTKE